MTPLSKRCNHIYKTGNPLFKRCQKTYKVVKRLTKELNLWYSYDVLPILLPKLDTDIAVGLIVDTTRLDEFIQKIIIEPRL